MPIEKLGRKKTSDAAFLELLATQGPLSGTEAAAFLECTPHNARNRLHALERAGQIFSKIKRMNRFGMPTYRGELAEGSWAIRVFYVASRPPEEPRHTITISDRVDDAFHAELRRSRLYTNAVIAAIREYLLETEERKELADHLRLMVELTEAKGLDAERNVLLAYFGAVDCPLPNGSAPTSETDHATPDSQDRRRPRDETPPDAL